MSERETPDSQAPRNGSSKAGIISIVVAGLLIVILIIVVWSWLGDGDDEPRRQPAPVQVSDPEPVTQPPVEPDPVDEHQQMPDPMVDTSILDLPPVEREPEVAIPDLDESTPVVVEAAQERDLNTRPLRSEHLVRDLVIFAHNLSDGDIIRESAAVRGPDARFATQTVDDQLYIDERSYARYNEVVEWFVNLDSESLVSVYTDYEPLFRQAFGEIAHPDERFIDQVLDGIDVLLATPEPEGLLALSDDQVMYTFADPELEELPAAQKQMLRLGLENQRQVKRKLREIRALLEERR